MLQWFELKWKRSLGRKTILRNMMILSLFASIIPVIAVGFGSYLFSASVVQSEVNGSNLRILNNVSSTIDSALDRIQNNAIQMLLGSFFTSNLTDLKQTNYTGFYSSISRELAALQSGNKEASDIAMYVPDEGYLISPNYGGRRITGEKEREALQQELASEDQIKWITGPYPNLPGYGGNGVTLIAKVPLQSNKPIGLLFIRIEDSMFRSILDRFVSYPNEHMYILNANGELVASTGKEAVPEGLSSRVKGSEGGVKRSLFEWNGTEYMVTPSISETYKWQYMDMVPVKQLNAKAGGIALITISIVVIVLMLGICFVLWGTRRVYRPIERLIDHVKDGAEQAADTDEIGFVRMRWAELSSTTSKLQLRLREQQPLLRESFALQLLQGRYQHYSGNQLVGMLRRYEVPAGREHFVFVIAFDAHHGESSRFQESDNELIVFAVKNMTSDLLRSQEMEGIVINLLNDQVAVWLFPNAEQSVSGLPDIKSSVERIRMLISDYLGLPVSVGLSRPTEKIEELPELYEEAVLAVRSRIIVGSSQVITHVIGDSELHYRYPVEIETHLENSLQLGDRNEAERMLNEFAKSMQNAVQEPELVQMSYYRLLIAVTRTSYLLGLDSAQLFGEKNIDPYTQIRKINSIHELNHWFRDYLIEPVTAYVRGKQDQEHVQLIQKVVRYIEDNYHFDLSLDQCAQICGLSPHYLSKLFKKTMDLSFIEYLTKYRLDRSIELLRGTDLTIAEIAEKVGYQTKNFIRVFKKHIGATPGQFREADKE
ncbi:AraC family transcriptional regulator [Paenibacillus filicis]|uniref:AraC family transcriptional regulator n=1 Tax=Paenibacillus gyeongsangnamensis TaxID=3388067 RepID=A0ABT4Q2I8_9BACL|nr:helix-turn-helix domain-containing protein [Paenibacillus filicis]MCZ8511095.1 AraC family transcriptional regulator [Paenibacillus filicis]